MGYSPQGHKQLDKTEATKTHTQDIKYYIIWTSLKILYLIMKQEIPFLNSKSILLIWLEILLQLYLKILKTKTKWVHAIISSWIEMKVDASQWTRGVCQLCNSVSHENPLFPWKQWCCVTSVWRNYNLVYFGVKTGLSFLLWWYFLWIAVSQSISLLWFGQK